MNTSSLIVAPLIIMFLLGLISTTQLTGVSSSPFCLQTSSNNYCTQNVYYTDLGIIVTVLALAIGLGVAGVNILGSGINAMGTLIIAKAVLFGVLWALATVLSINLITQNFFTDIMYVALTLTYLSGVVLNIGGFAD